MLFCHGQDIGSGCATLQAVKVADFDVCPPGRAVKVVDAGDRWCELQAWYYDCSLNLI